MDIWIAFWERNSCTSGTEGPFTQISHLWYSQFSFQLPGAMSAVIWAIHSAWSSGSYSWEVTVGMVVALPSLSLLYVYNVQEYSCSLFTMRRCRWSFTSESLKAHTFLFNFLKGQYHSDHFSTILPCLCIILYHGIRFPGSTVSS